MEFTCEVFCKNIIVILNNDNNPTFAIALKNKWANMSTLENKVVLFIPHKLFNLSRLEILAKLPLLLYNKPLNSKTYWLLNSYL